MSAAHYKKGGFDADGFRVVHVEIERSRFTPTVPAPRPPASSETRLATRGWLVDLGDHRPVRPHELEALGWRLEYRARFSKTSVWAHRDGWKLEHCGHPTAHHPWALYNARGALICTGAAGPHRDAAFGTAWTSLRMATTFVAHPEARAFLHLAPELGR